MAISEAQRLPDASRDYFDLMFGTAERRLAEFLTAEFDISPERSESVASALLSRTIYAPLLATLFAVEQPVVGTPDDAAPIAEIAVAQIRASVKELLAGAHSER